jgi:hypothetical protein
LREPPHPRGGGVFVSGSRGDNNDNSDIGKDLDHRVTRRHSGAFVECATASLLERNAPKRVGEKNVSSIRPSASPARAGSQRDQAAQVRHVVSVTPRKRGFGNQRR